MIIKILKSSLFKSAGIYGVTSIINAAVPFLIMPILTRLLNPTDYGIVAMFGVLMSFSAPFVGVSGNAAIGRQFFNKEEVDLKIYITNIYLILLASTFIVAVIVLFFAEQISDLAEFPKSWIWYVVLVSLCNFITATTLILWQVQSKPVSYGIFQVSNTFLNVALTILFVVLLKWTWQGRIMAQVISAVIFAIVGLYILYRNKWFKFEYNKKYIDNALRFGVPLIPHTLGAIIMTMSDRMFITNMVGISSTGLYAVGYALGNIIGFAENAFTMAFSPWLYEKLNRNDEAIKRRIVKFTYCYFVVILLMALFMTYVTPYFLVFFVGPKFLGAQDFVFWIAMSFAFSGMYKMVVHYIFYVEKTKILAMITFFCALINIALTFVLIKQFGAVGAAMANCFVSIIFFLLTWLLSNRVYKMPWLLQKYKSTDF
jgi:O-antigen/teichoic acid export membrane protein